jgi:hypothetical protein
MGYLNAHFKYVIEKAIAPPRKAQRGRVYELRYDSETATQSRYLVLGINVFPKRASADKQLLHCLDMDLIPITELKKIIRTATTIKERKEYGIDHQRLEIDGRNRDYYNKQLKKLQKMIPGMYKTFKVSKIKKFELCNYDFMSIADPALKKKLGLV